MGIKKIVLYLLAFTSHSNCETPRDTPAVGINKGTLSGKWASCRGGKGYQAFLGIRYGFSQRFQVATIHEDYQGTINATEFGPMCTQFDPVTNKIVGEEDCLFLNVFVPETTWKKNAFLPVIVWIHGGGFSFGSSNLYNPDYFMAEQSVIVVTFNYRLGAFGFLDTGDGTVQGNLGLLDQTLALEWVANNIASFGGDSSNITLFGSSAGASSVALHMLTNTSNLFHRAISHSGTALSGWLMQRKPKENSEKLAKIMGCPFLDIHQMVKCLKEKSDLEIVTAVSAFEVGSFVSKANFVFTPSIDNSYLTKCPTILMKEVQYRIPWIVGFTEDDGLLNLNSEKDELIPKILDEWNTIAPWLLVYNDDVMPERQDAISSQIKKHFHLEDTDANKSEVFWKKLAQLIGDRWEKTGTITSVMNLWNKIPIYPFIFSYQGNFSYTNQFNKQLQSLHGVGHMDELQYLFKGLYGAPEYNGESELSKFSQRFVRIWTQFSATGVPGIPASSKWNSVTSRDIKFYKMETSSIEQSEEYALDSEFKQRIDFWNSILPSCHHESQSAPRVEL